MILGGAQENTLLTLQGLKRDTSWDLRLACGPELGGEGSLMDAVQACGVQVDSLRWLRRDLNPWEDWRAFRELLGYFQRERFDLVHTHSSKAGFLGRIAARKAGVPRIVHTIHGLAFDELQPSWKNTLYIHAEKIAAKNCDAILSVCNTMTQQALAAGVGAAPLFHTIFSGFPMAPLLALPPPVREPRFRVGAIARMFPLKGHEDLMKLAPDLLREWNDLDFLVVGDGPMRRNWNAWLAAHPEWISRFHFTGRIAPEEAPSQIAKMDMLLHLSWREGLARVIPQALAARRPVCVYDVGGAGEVVKNGETGRLLPLGDLDGIRAAVRAIRTDPNAAREMAERGRELVQKLFAVETMQHEILDLYRRLNLKP